MTIRLLASYQFIDKDGQAGGMVRLPVVGYAPPDKDERERPRVLLLSGDDPYLTRDLPAHSRIWRHTGAATSGSAPTGARSRICVRSG